MANGFVHPEYLVETEWLAEHLQDAKVRVFDCTVHLVPPTKGGPYDAVPARADFEKTHIPGAAFVDMDHDVADTSQSLHFMLPSAEHFTSAMRRFGVNRDTKVVTYASANHWWATRMWWMLKVFGHDNAAVLNGGLQKWLREGRRTETGPTQSRPSGDFTAQLRPGHVATKQDVLAAFGDKSICTLNALRPEQHAGGGPTNYGRPGRIAGSANVAAANLVDENNVFKSPEVLRAMLAEAMAKPQVITYCGGGIAASSVTLVLNMLGYDKVKLYDASLSEWAVDPSLPMEVG